MSKHLKRRRAPKFWRVPRKEKTWVVSPRPGPHKKFESIPLLILIRDILKLVDTGKDAKKIIKAKEIFVDGKARNDHKYPVGLFDVVEIPKLGKQYRVVPTHKGLDIVEIQKKEAKLKICRINDKTMIRDGVLQLNLHDGKNILIKKEKKTKDVYKTGDSLSVEIPRQKIIEHIKMEKGSSAVLIGGQNIGELVKIKDVIKTKSREPNKVICQTKEKEFEAIKDYIFVVGKTKPVIKLSD